MSDIGPPVFAENEREFLRLMVAGLVALSLRLDLVLREEMIVDAGPPNLLAGPIARSIANGCERAEHWFKVKHTHCATPRDVLAKLCTKAKDALTPTQKLVEVIRSRALSTNHEGGFKTAFPDDYAAVLNCAEMATAALNAVRLSCPELTDWAETLQPS